MTLKHIGIFTDNFFSGSQAKNERYPTNTELSSSCDDNNDSNHNDLHARVVRNALGVLIDRYWNETHHRNKIVFFKHFWFSVRLAYFVGLHGKKYVRNENYRKSCLPFFKLESCITKTLRCGNYIKQQLKPFTPDKYQIPRKAVQAVDNRA